MELNNEEKKVLDEYLNELNNRKKLSVEEINEKIALIKEDPYLICRELIQYHFYLAYDIAKNYEKEELTILDFINAANEGLEVGVVSLDYSDYDSFMDVIKKSIKDSIELMLSFFDEKE